MKDLFSITQMIKVLHAPICIYSKEGEVVNPLEDITEKHIIEKKEFTDQVNKKFPYIHVEKDGTTYALLWDEAKEQYVGLGKLRIYNIDNEAAKKYPYCHKDEFAAIVSVIWNLMTGEKVSIGQLWDKNIKLDIPMEVELTKDIFELQEEGVSHNPYSQELREQDSIRRGDVAALQKSIDEVYSGKLGELAGDVVRQTKNLAISVISCAARSAIKGGINPEFAFSMADTYIRNIEMNMDEPIKIEKATRKAEFAFAEEVSKLKSFKKDNPLVNQVRDYVFCHIHEPIRVREIAEYVGVTPNYLSEQFSQAMGMTLKQYIIDEKITSSENLLKYSNYSLQEISSFCAFSSQSRFSVYFQRKNGITPAKYRKKYRKAPNE